MNIELLNTEQSTQVQTVPVEPQNSTVVQPPIAQQNSTSLQKKKSSNFIFMLFGLLLLVVAGSGAYIYWQVSESIDNIVDTRNQIPNSELTQISTSTPNPSANWKTYSNTELGFEFKYPAELEKYGTPTVEKQQGETGDLVCVYWKSSQQSFSLIQQVYAGGGGCAGTNFVVGLLSADYSAGREGGFSDTLGYEVKDGKFFYKHIGGSTSEVSTQLASLITNPYDTEILKVTGEDSKAMRETQEVSFPTVGTPGDGILGAIINTKKGKYPAITLQYNKASYPDLSADSFDKILSTFKFVEQTSSVDTSTWKTYTGKDFTFKYPTSGKLVDSAGVVKLTFPCDVATLSMKSSNLELQAYLESMYPKDEKWRYDGYVPNRGYFNVDQQPTMFVGPAGVGETDAIYFSHSGTIFGYYSQPQFIEGSVPPAGVVCEGGEASQILSTFQFTK